MRRQYSGKYLKFLLLSGLFVIGSAGTVMATSQSDNFEATEVEFGAGSALNMCSGEYCAQASIGNISGGRISSPSKTADFDSDIPTSDDPMLEVIVEEGASDLGILTTDATASKETVIKIRNYLSDGYTLHIIGEPPKYQDHTLATPTSPTAATPGTEQFAINVVANSTPEVGSDPVQVPDDGISFGYVLPNYATADRFMYESGAAVARSDSETGRTDYTISMIVNVAGNTPAGHFQGDFSAVIMPLF